MKIREIRDILNLHTKWFESGGSEGSRANLWGADLRGADLRGAYLCGANLREAKLEAVDLSGANLRNADLSGAHLYKANLRNVDLSFARLHFAIVHKAFGIMRKDRVDGWAMYAVRWDDGPRIKAGCRWFTVAEALDHWGKGCAGRREHGDKMLAGVENLLSGAKVLGWKV